jgi:hypothetical protein
VFDRGARIAGIDSIDTRPDPDGFRRFLLAAVGPGPSASDVAFDAVSVGRQPISCP